MSGLRPGENEAASVIDAARKVVDAELRIRRESHPGIERSKLSELEHTRSHYIDMLGLDLLLLDRALREARGELRPSEIEGVIGIGDSFEVHTRDGGVRPSDTSADDDEGTCPECRRIGGIHAIGCNFGNAVAERARAMRVSDAFAAAVRRFGKAADASVGETRYIDPDYLPAREALQAMVRGTSLVTGIAPHDPTGVSAPNPEAGSPPREEPFYVDGRPIDVDDDDDDARGWTVNGRPVSARDVDHGDAQAEAENPWTVNGAPIPEPKDEHAKCRARLEAEKARVRRAIGLLTDIAKPARVAIGFLDAEGPRG